MGSNSVHTIFSMMDSIFVSEIKENLLQVSSSAKTALADYRVLATEQLLNIFFCILHLSNV